MSGDRAEAAEHEGPPAFRTDRPRTAAPAQGDGGDAIGLDEAEAARRLQRDGPNALPQGDRRTLLRTVRDTLREPMFLLLSGAAGLYWLLGDTAEALTLGVSVLVVIAITVYQEGRSERALAALRDLSSPRAAVLRGGVPRRVAAAELVVGDVVLLAEGDRVPADVHLLAGRDVRVDESLLTGEFAPVEKFVGEVAAPDAPLMPSDPQRLFCGTLLVAGHATARVVAVGARTAVGRIGGALGQLGGERSPLQREVDHAVVVFAAIGLALCGLVAVLYAATRGGWIDALLSGITLAIANVPEEFPVVLTIFLALGAWRLARQRVLTRRAPAIETLGAVTLLCVDKTGTLTENRMHVAALRQGERLWLRSRHDAEVPPEFAELLHTAALASELTAFDPMEKAILAVAPQRADAADGWELIEEYALAPDLLAHTHVWRAGADARRAVACKGAPEAVAQLCALEGPARDAVFVTVRAWGRAGLRVIAVAAAPLAAHEALPDTQRGFRFRWLGLVGFADPLRAGVREAVAEAREAGVRVAMLTGDHPDTAAAIAEQAGIAQATAVVTGAQMAALAPQAVAGWAAAHRVFARVVPEQKLRLVQAFKANGDIVAMTGDGVNDAPALKAAHVGIAMGGRGTDVAREAAALVLQDDDFVSIVRAIRLGRGIYANIERALRYILAVHVPVTGIALLPLLVGGPIVLWPIHIVFLELIIDPACAVVFEREPPSADLMRRPPRDVRRRLLDRRLLLGSLLDGVAALAACATVYAIARRCGVADGGVAALTFASVVAGNLGLIALHRGGAGWRRALRASNPAFWSVVALAAAALALSLGVPAIRALFRFDAPPGPGLAAALAAPWLAGAVARAVAGRVRVGTGDRSKDAAAS